jgi:hypothetical protein
MTKKLVHYVNFKAPTNAVNIMKNKIPGLKQPRLVTVSAGVR